MHSHEGRSSDPLGSDSQAVEVDETYWGNKFPYGKGPGGTGPKMKIVLLVERDGHKRYYHVANVNVKSVTTILRAQISQKARLMTDEHKVYTLDGKEFVEHSVVNHRLGEYARGDVTTNTVESSFEILKHGLYGVYHHVSEARLQRHAIELDLRGNHRKKWEFDDSAYTLAELKGIAGQTLMYRDSLPL